MSRSNQEIIDQTIELARSLYAIQGYRSEKGFKFYDSHHPHEIAAWHGACAAQLMLTGTDVNDVLDEEVDGQEGKPPEVKYTLTPKQHENFNEQFREGMKKALKYRARSKGGGL